MQVVGIPVAAEYVGYLSDVAKQVAQQRYRVEVDGADESMQK